MTLDGKTIVVGGGTGDVGEGIVQALADAGAKVIVPARSAEKAGRLRATLTNPEQLTVIEIDLRDDASVETLGEALQMAGPIDGAIAALGPWFRFGKLAETKVGEFQAAFDALLKSHFLYAKSVLPIITDGGTYITVNGAGSEAPVPESSSVSIMAHGLNMLAQTISAEHPTLHNHTRMLRSVIATRVRPTHDTSWVTAREVGEAAAWLFTPTGRLTAGSTLSLNPKLVEAAP